MKYNGNTYTGPSFSLKNRIHRLIWGIIYTLFFRYSPRPFHAWRSFILKLFGAKVGKGVHVYPKVKIWAPWNLELKDECGIADGVILYSQGKIKVGKRVIISQDSYICTGTHDYTKKGHPLVIKPIIIDDFSWITVKCFIHPGVTIGEGAVIGACSVVTKDMPSWMVCAGHPCKAIKERKIKD